MLIEALLGLGISQIIITALPFKRIAGGLGEYMQESALTSNAAEIPLIKSVSWAISIMSRHTIWESKCLAQAITAKYMLRRRNIKSTLYLGVAKNEKQEMLAHAWLRSGEKIVTGARTKENFVVLSSFADL